MLMKHIFFQQLPLGCRNLQSWLFDPFARDRAGRTIAPRTGGDMGTPNRPGLNCPTTLDLGHASYQTTTQDSLSTVCFANQVIIGSRTLSHGGSSQRYSDFSSSQVYRIPTKLVFTTCARMSSLKEINLEQLSEASMITSQTDSVALFPNISMGFQDGSSTLLQDRGRVRRDQLDMAKRCRR